MTQPIPATPVSTTPSCWESFTNSVSTGMTKVAEGVTRLWLWIKNGIQSMCASIRPYGAKMLSWIQSNQQQAAIAGGVAALAAGVGAYFFCCNKDKTVVAATVTTPATGTPANPATGTTTTTATVKTATA